jgi:hypothetical protein
MSTGQPSPSAVARGGPITPPGSRQSTPRGGPITPPGAAPRSSTGGQSLISDYQHNVGAGSFLRITDCLNYTARINAAHDAGHAAAVQAREAALGDEIGRLKATHDGQRMLLARTPLLRAIHAARDDTGPTPRVQLVVGTASHDIHYPGEAAAAAVEAMAHEMRLLGEVNLPFITSESEQPVWPFLHALRLHQHVAPAKFRHTCEVLDVVNDVVAVPIYVIKHWLQVKRPKDVDPSIKPWIPTPLHASFPSGHASYAHAAAVVLNALIAPSDLTAFPKLAAAVAKRRELAGLHTHLDTAAGTTLGTAIGQHMVELATQGEAPELASWQALFVMAASEWLGPQDPVAER